MADYHAPTVIEQVIPLTAMTPLEHLLLGLVFDAEDEDGGIYFHSWCGPSDIVTVPLDDLRAASQLSRGVAGSVIGAHVEALIATFDAQADAEPHDDIDLDLSDREIGWNRILQDIVRRSPTLGEIVVWTAFTCTKMRSDGFGGAVTRITADAIQYESTDRMLGAMRRGAAPPAPTNADGRETRARLEALAASAGWDSFTLSLLIAAWADRHGHSQALTDHLGRLITDGIG